ncbi:hypothetical protein pb186bvf_003559 [Paramecium bursaria]
MGNLKPSDLTQMLGELEQQQEYTLKILQFDTILMKKLKNTRKQKQKVREKINQILVADIHVKFVRIINQIKKIQAVIIQQNMIQRLYSMDLIINVDFVIKNIKELQTYYYMREILQKSKFITDIQLFNNQSCNKLKTKWLNDLQIIIFKICQNQSFQFNHLFLQNCL